MKLYFCKHSLLVGILFLLCSLPLLFVGIVVFQVLRSQIFLQQQEASLRKPEVYKPVAQTLALYCQSDPHFFPKYLAAAWFPTQVRTLNQGFGRGPEQCEGVYQNKIQLLLRFNRVVDARKTCQTMLTTLPGYWWGYLINALILTQTQSAAQGEQFLRHWVERQPNFFSYLDLAYYYQLERQPQRAAEAMIAATAYDANVDWGHDGNAEYRGYTAAMYALKSGQYPAAIRLCDKLLTVTVNGGYAKSALQALREAATRRAAGQPAALRWDEGMERFDPFGKIDLEKLLQRPRKHSPKHGSLR